MPRLLELPLKLQPLPRPPLGSQVKLVEKAVPRARKAKPGIRTAKRRSCASLSKIPAKAHVIVARIAPFHITEGFSTASSSLSEDQDGKATKAADKEEPVVMETIGIRRSVSTEVVLRLLSPGVSPIPPQLRAPRAQPAASAGKARLRVGRYNPLSFLGMLVSSRPRRTSSEL